MKIVTALNDPSTSLTYAGLIQLEGRQARLIRAQPVSPAQIDPNGELSELTTTDIEVDANSYPILETVDTVYPTYDSTTTLAYDPLNRIASALSQATSGTDCWGEVTRPTRWPT